MPDSMTFLMNTLFMFLICIILVTVGLYFDKEWDPMQAMQEVPITFMLLLVYAAVGSYAAKKYVDPILNMLSGTEKTADNVADEGSAW